MVMSLSNPTSCTDCFISWTIFSFVPPCMTSPDCARSYNFSMDVEKSDMLFLNNPKQKSLKRFTLDRIESAIEGIDVNLVGRPSNVFDFSVDTILGISE